MSIIISTLAVMLVFGLIIFIHEFGHFSTAKLFKVKVADVNTINMKKKPRRVGVHAGFKKAWKKAIVTLTEDSNTIEFFDGMI